MTAAESFSIDDSVFRLPSADLLLELTTPLTIRSSLHEYSVEFHRGEFLSANVVARDYGSSSTLLVSDRLVFDLHFATLPELSRSPTLLLEGTEELKSIEGVERVVDFFIHNEVSRHERVVVVGGGTIQDVVGFACAIYKRGIPWSFLPSTLLAQSDSCIGSKTGLNFRRTKNLLGAFSAPGSISVHSAFLRTLSDDDVLSGLGEIFKLTTIAGPDYVEAFETLLDRGMSHDVDVLVKLARLGLAIKQPVIEFDEFEQGARKALNFGHSIGHALEITTDYAVPHGIAVCFGMLVESALGCSIGVGAEEDFRRMAMTGSSLLGSKFVCDISKLDVDELCEVIRRDKKASQGALSLPILRTFGSTVFVTLDLGATLSSALALAFETAVEAL